MTQKNQGVGNAPSSVLTCEWANEYGRVKRVQECTEPATERVRNVLGVNYYCKRHARLVRLNEADWDRAEAAYLERE